MENKQTLLEGHLSTIGAYSVQGQYCIEYLYLLLATPPYMATANFVVITNGGGCALTGTADIDQ